MDILRDTFSRVFPMYRSPAPAIPTREPRRAHIGAPPGPPPIDVTLRTVFEESSVSLWAWPSRGGLIVLQCATAVDFDFLGLDRGMPPLQRHSSPSAEDDFCRRLLLLGAKWWDSQGALRLL